MGAAYYVEFLLRSTVSVETIRNAVIGASGNFTLQRGIAENGAPTSVFRQPLPHCGEIFFSTFTEGDQFLFRLKNTAITVFSLSGLPQ